MAKRVVVWFSAGVASAVAAKLAVRDYGHENVAVYNIEVAEEHPDNRWFVADVEGWLGVPITVVGNDEYRRSIYEVFRRTRFLVGPKGARCTGELKRAVRWEHQRPDDTVVLGFTADEQHRADRIAANEPWVEFDPILIRHGLTKHDCHNLARGAGLVEPEMYRLGYPNANCIGCVKGQAGYWNKIRQDFPDVFDRMARLERELGRSICKIERVVNGERTLRRVFLDELPPDAGRTPTPVLPDCGILCEMEAELAFGHGNGGMG